MTEIKRTPIRWLIMAWLVLAAIAVFWGLNSSDSELGPDAIQALDDANIPYERVAIDGRDVVITGDLSEAQEASARALVAGIDGVRTVRIQDVASTQSTQTTTTLATSIGEPIVETTTNAIAAEGVSRISATLKDGALLLTGVVPSPEVAGGIQQVTDLIYAPLVDNTLTVDQSVEPATWLPNIPRAIGVLPIVGSATLEIEGQNAFLTAEAPRAQDAAALEGAIAQLLGPEVNLTSNVTVTGKQLPVVLVNATTDGKLVIDGVLPDQRTIDNIFAGAAGTYGQANVTNNLATGENVERAFTIFRIPGIFAEFRAVPQWTLAIENGTFSGSLQGGATFESGSAQLTNELRALLNIAAGVMARNPQLIATIEGHTDSVGSIEANQALSEARASAGASYLIQAGIDPARLTTTGSGEGQPIATNETEEGRAQNRRLDFKLAQS